MRSAMRLTGLAMLLAAGQAGAAEAPAPDPRQGDGRVSAFYTWRGTIPDKPGEWLRTEPLDPLIGLPEAGTQTRILYTSTDGIDGRTPVVESGAVFTPKGAPPAGGWPIIAWAHGTVGVADNCAPSWQTRSFRDLEYLDAWLDQGFAIVAADYQGLGTPGPHPYLAARPAAYSVLDGIRAARGGLPDLANKVVIVGQSQGGAAAFATAGIAPEYAPELDIRGTVATGIPYLTAQTFHDEMTGGDANRVEPTLAYLLYIALVVEQIKPGVDLASVFSDQARPVLDLARNTCVGSLFSDVAAARLSRAGTFRADPEPLFLAVVPYFAYTTLKLRQPLFVGTGQADHDVAPSQQLALVKAACAAGSTVQAHLYAGLNHSQTVNASLKDSVPFVRRVMEGEKVTPNCDPQPQ